MIESSPIMSTDHVIIRAVTGHDNPKVTHVVRGKSVFGRMRVRRDTQGMLERNRSYISCPTRADLLEAVNRWYTPAEPPADKK